MMQDVQRSFPEDRLGLIESVTPLTIGMSGAAVYAVKTPRGEFVLRKQMSDPDAWHRTLAWHRLAAAHGIAPQLVHVDEAGLVTVSVKVNGMPFGAALASPEQRSAAFASLTTQLAMLHAIPSDGAPPLDVPALARAVWGEQSQRPGFPAWASSLDACIAPAAAALAKDPRLALSHGDPNPGNMLWDGTRVWFLDWERAGRAHPYLDLAIVANFLSLPEPAALALLAQQEKAPVDGARARLFGLVRDLARVVYGCVFLRLAADLRAVSFPSRTATPTLGECFALMMQGKLDMKTAQGQGLFAAAFFKQVSAQ